MQLLFESAMVVVFFYGSGILSDRIRKSVYDLELYSSKTFGLYQTLLMSDDGVVFDAETSYKMLTGIEIHTCWQFDAQTDSPVRVRISSGEK